MTETDWLTATDPHEMLAFLEPPPGNWLARLFGWLHLKAPGVWSHNLQFFACACCRRLWELLPDARSRSAIETLEEYAGGRAGRRVLRRAASAATAAALEANGPRPATGPRLAAAQARAAEAVAAAFDPHEGAHLAANWAREAVRAWAHGPAAQNSAYVEKKWQRKKRAKMPPPRKVSLVHEGEAEWQAERKAQCESLRDIFGNPFHPQTRDQTWLTPKVLDRARSIANNRSFQNLPQLADYLEEAGCTNQDLLGHCRAPGPHVSGCWVLGLLLR
jgi:hypothetical protein